LKNCRAAFTLIEFLIALSIVAVLTALMMGQMPRVLRSARTSANAEALRQCQKAIALYIADQGSHEMSIEAAPRLLQFVNLVKSNQLYGLQPQSLVSKCGKHPDSVSSAFLYGGIADTESLEQIQRFAGPPIIFMDHNCNDPETDLKSAYTTKFSQSVDIEGTYRLRRARGIVDSINFWREL
jgi:prepilin-type N-terminal cleavage/methylation domain-containing protein